MPNGNKKVTFGKCLYTFTKKVNAPFKSSKHGYEYQIFSLKTIRDADRLFRGKSKFCSGYFEFIIRYSLFTG